MATLLRLAAIFTIVASATAAPQLPSASQDQTVPATGLILGRVIDVSGGAGVGSAIVTVSLAGAFAPAGAPAAPLSLRFPIRLVCDGEGRFLFHDLPKGSYSITASKPGYGDSSYGRRSPSDTTNSLLVLADAERKTDVTVVMWKLASISGTVTDEAGEPVVGLPISLFRRTFIGGRPRFTQAGAQASTDDRGMYRAPSLAPGDYVAAIVTTETTVSLAWKTASAAAFRTDSLAINRELGRSISAPFGVILTAGQRVGGLSLSNAIAPGVPAPPVAGDKVFVYPTTFYPTAPAPSKAMVITLGSGEERAGVDFQVRPTPTSRISGMITGPDGPEGGVGMELIDATTDEADRDPVFAVAESVSDANGDFTFLGVPVGNYVIRVQKNPPQADQNANAGMTTVIQTADGGTITTSSGPGGPSPPVTNDPTLWAQAPVSVTGADVTGLNVTLRTGARLSGRVQFVGSAPQPTAAQLAQMSVNVQAAGGRTQASLTINGGAFYSTRGSVDANGFFKTYQFPPGRFVIRATQPAPGWVFSSATFRGRDVADAPIEVSGEDLTDIVITFTDKPSELSGNVHGAQGADAAATVLVFPADPANWMDYGPASRRLRLVRPSSDGSYKTTLPAGEYLVTAIHSSVPSTWTDPEFLKQAAATATHVTMAEGSNKVQDLKSTEVR